LRIDTTNLTPEAHRAIIECLKIAAQRGRQLREARELEQNTTLAARPNVNPADGAYDELTEEKESQERNAAQHPRIEVVEATASGSISAVANGANKRHNLGSFGCIKPQREGSYRHRCTSKGNRGQ
jgi:hypothetical protein